MVDVRSDRSGSRELGQIFAFVRARYEEQARSADALVSSWGRSFVHLLDAMWAHLVEAPPSAYEVQRFLLRTAAAHHRHADYQPHWMLAVPRQRSTS